MANIGMKHLLFLFSVHAILMYGADHGLIGETQVGQSDQFVSSIQNGNVTESADIGDKSGIASDISLAIQAVPIIGDLYDLITTPYGLMINSNLPGLIKTLFLGIMSILEIGIFIKVIRGVNF